MKIVIFSGTTEGRTLSCTLAEWGAQVTVCVATEYGKIDQGSCPGVRVCAGRLSAAGMAALLEPGTLCVDATHPYAVQVTENIRRAAATAGTRYIRLLRAASPLPEDCLAVNTAGQAVAFLQRTEGNILLTTGAKELSAFAPLGAQRLVARVLPLESSLTACKQAGILPAHIVAMQGPFSMEMNVAILHQFDIRYLVTKDGGTPGGFTEKLSAARKCGVHTIVIRRPEEDGMPYDQVLKMCKEWIAQCR